jgi:hypothetical protein
MFILGFPEAPEVGSSLKESGPEGPLIIQSEPSALCSVLYAL